MHAVYCKILENSAKTVNILNHETNFCYLVVTPTIMVLET